MNLQGTLPSLCYFHSRYVVCCHGILHPLSYRVIQTLIFHSIMTVWGVVSLIYERERIELKKCSRDLAVLLGMTVWALIGNYTYNGTVGEYSHFFNWFFVVRDPFYAIPEAICPFVMPFLNVAIFFAAEMLMHLVLHLMKARSRRF